MRKHPPPSKEPIITAQIAKQQQRGGSPTAIFTDLDGTFVMPGNEAATKAAAELFRDTQANDYPIIAVTGRATERVLTEIEAGVLPRFNAVIGAVGTEILLQYPEGYHRDETFAQLQERKYYREQVVAKSEQLIKRGNRYHPAARLQFQIHKTEEDFEQPPDSSQQPFKVSLYCYTTSTKELRQITAMFKRAFPGLKVIVSEEIYYNSSHRSSPKKYNLDILASGKGAAIRYLMKTYNITQGIVAGDSGNDIDALLVPGLVAVLVGGHRAKARAAIAARLPQVADDDRSFQKIGNKHIFIDTDRERFGAQSMLIAMQYLHASPEQRRTLIEDLARELNKPQPGR